MLAHIYGHRGTIGRSTCSCLIGEQAIGPLHTIDQFQDRLETNGPFAARTR